MNLLEFLEKTKTVEMMQEEKGKKDYGWYGNVWQTKQGLLHLKCPRAKSSKGNNIYLNTDALHILNIMRLANSELTLDTLIDYIRDNINKEMVSGLSGFMATLLERYMDIWSYLGVVDNITKPGTDRGKYASSMIQVEGVPENDRVYKINLESLKEVDVLDIKPTINKNVDEGITFFEVSILAAMHTMLGGKTDVPITDEQEIRRYYPIGSEVKYIA